MPYVQCMRLKEAMKARRSLWQGLAEQISPCLTSYFTQRVYNNLLHSANMHIPLAKPPDLQGLTRTHTRIGADVNPTCQQRTMPNHLFACKQAYTCTHTRKHIHTCSQSHLRRWRSPKACILCLCH